MGAIDDRRLVSKTPCSTPENPVRRSARHATRTTRPAVVQLALPTPQQTLRTSLHIRGCHFTISDIPLDRPSHLAAQCGNLARDALAPPQRAPTTRRECFARGALMQPRRLPRLDASVSRGPPRRTPVARRECSARARVKRVRVKLRGVQLSRYDRTAVSQCRTAVNFLMWC